MAATKRFYCVRQVDAGGMCGPTLTHAVVATAPEPEAGLTVREVDPATDLFAWAPRPALFTEPPEYAPA